jgi:hypothetical protein
MDLYTPMWAAWLTALPLLVLHLQGAAATERAHAAEAALHAAEKRHTQDMEKLRVQVSVDSIQFTCRQLCVQQSSQRPAAVPMLWRLQPMGLP